MAGQDDVSTLASVNILVSVLQNQGKYEAAKELNQRALEGREKALGKEHPYTLSSLSNLAAVLRSLAEKITLSAKVLGYLNDVKDASKGRTQCAIEISNLHSLLYTLHDRIENRDSTQPWHITVQDLAVKNGPLDQFKQALETLQSKITEEGRLNRVGKALVWNFEKEEIASILDRIERLKSLVEIVLRMDHFKLSQVIKDDTNFVRTHVPGIQSGVDEIRQDQIATKHRSDDMIKRRQEGTGQWFHETAGERERQWEGEKKSLPRTQGIKVQALTPLLKIGPGHIAEDCLNLDCNTSIVDLLELLELPTHLSARELLAEKLQIRVGPTGSAQQNLALHKALLKELARNGGEVPSNIRNCDECGKSGHWADRCPDVVGHVYSEALERKDGQSKGDYARENNILSPTEDFQKGPDTPELRHTSPKEPDEEDLEMENLHNTEDVLSACADEEDSADDSWELGSWFSNDMQSNSSRTSFSSTTQISATDAFASLLIADDEIRSLCVNAITDLNVGPARLERNLRQLLYRYSKDLSEEAASPAQLIVVKYLQSRSWLQRIANKVRRTVCEESSSLDIGKEPLDPGAKIQRFLDSLSRPNESVLEERSSESSSSDDDQEGGIDEPREFNVQSLAAFLSNSRAFQLLKQNLQDFVFSTFSCRLDRVSQRILKQTGGALNKDTTMLLSVISQLHSVNPVSFLVSDLHVSLIDKWKYEVERLSGTTWNWWPLREPVYPLLPGHIYLLWQCRCGARRRAQVPVWVGKSLSRVSNMFKSSSKSTLPTHTQNVALQAQIISRNDADSSKQGSNEAARGSSGTANSTPPRMAGYVFLGVKRGGEHNVAEINVHGLGDDQFFKELRAEYYKMKGYLRRFFSVWRFTHCDFVKVKLDSRSSKNSIMIVAFLGATACLRMIRTIDTYRSLENPRTDASNRPSRIRDKILLMLRRWSTP
ncbi:hypothetical protein BCR34DRAFT_591111 [Clohesyomyces aquaticus]|uniref:CCHC-type domain-containing protein n=1 Tax=Clohesyomyces aquaticus TaxID=1231657 RepID=A0A1Y1Z3U1_9PLEO|nr:hypothetical protein BCR34DRAFT_591111 [Clohesyomyces aquaticus]